MSRPPDPDPFHDTFIAMAGARAVITATRLGVFDALGYASSGTRTLGYASSGMRNYTRREVAGWLRQAGFSDPPVVRNQRSPWRLLYLARA